MKPAYRIVERNYELPDSSYDGRNGFPTYHVNDFAIVEVAFVFGKEQTDLVAVCPTREKAELVHEALTREK